MNDKPSTYTFRVPENLKNAFEIACKSMDRTGAQTLRDSMRQVVDYHMKHNAQADLLTPTKKAKK
jgi:predicted transcriptional regulator